MIVGWLRSDASMRAGCGQAMAASEEGKRAADLATAAHEVALKDVEAAKEHCRVAEAELKTMCNERATEARQHEAREEKLKAREDAVAGRDTELEQSAREQAAKRDRLEKLKKEVEEEKVRLRDALGSAAAVLPANKVATREDAVAVATAAKRNAPAGGGGGGKGVADAVAAAADMNEKRMTRTRQA